MEFVSVYVYIALVPFGSMMHLLSCKIQYSGCGLNEQILEQLARATWPIQSNQ
jgi:nitrate reductase gamma subunit